MNHKLALDFGTTNSVISRWDDETEVAKIIDLPGVSVERVNGRPALVPSLLYVQNGQSSQVIAGQVVNSQELNRRRDNRFFRNFKRGIVASPAPKPRSIDGTLWTDRDAGRSFIHHLLDLLPYQPIEIEQLILTAPVASFADYLDW